ncbi:MAG: hypothetical protein NW900_02175, partial [Candidatus Blochmannia sp. A2]|nr:hypothetical protein [Candidatus Blochmannia sp. A2]
MIQNHKGMKIIKGIIVSKIDLNFVSFFNNLIFHFIHTYIHTYIYLILLVYIYIVLFKNFTFLKFNVNKI